MLTLIDLTKPLTTESLSYPGDRPALAIGRIDIGDPDCLVSELTRLDLHAGTHIDAPLHFFPGATDIAGLGLRLLPAVVVETSHPLIGSEHVPAAIEGCAVLFNTGWAPELRQPEYFSGYSVLTPEAAQLLAARGAALVGLDTPSADPVIEPFDFAVHRILLGAGIPIVEGLANLEALADAPKPSWFAAFPLLIQGVEGSPVRAVAFVDTSQPD